MTNEEKIEIYEAILHKIQLYAEVTMDSQKLHDLIEKICRWSYSHRQGNGDCNGREERIENATKNLF
jgi:hypothetical protein